MNAMPPKLPKYGSTRERYNPEPNALEKKHRDNVRKKPCFGCGRHGATGHHTLLKWPGKRWRRDHRCLLPVCHDCHTAIHDYYGDEADWLASVNRTEDEAVAYIEDLWAESIGL